MRRDVVIALALFGFTVSGCLLGEEEDDETVVIIEEGDDETRQPPGGGSGGSDAGQGGDAVSDPGTDAGPTDTGDGRDGDDDDAGTETDGGGFDDDASSSPEVEEIDPTCRDGEYSEPLPKPGADISTAKSNYSSADVKGFIDTVLQKRYPVGQAVVDRALANGDRDCVERYLRDDSSANSVLNGLSTVVHECGHVVDLDASSYGESTYFVTPDLTITCSGGDTTSRGGETFPRSYLRDDEFQEEYPRCQSRDEQNCDGYAYTYFKGDPNNDELELGDQGFNSVLEETLQYINSLATSYAYVDAIGENRATSGLDGILSFLWYVERYLHLARTEYPDAYAHLKGSQCWRRAILTMWGRAWLMIDAAKEHDQLGIKDEKLFELVRTPELLQEIERIRQAHGCQ